MSRFPFTVLAGFFLAFGLSCSGSSTVSPDTEAPISAPVSREVHTSRQNTYLWGIWDVSIDYETGRITPVPMRGAYFSLNVTGFIDKPPSNLHLTNFQVDKTDPSWVFINVDVGIEHPFPGLDNLYGFDVMGVFMGNGGDVYPGDESLFVAGNDDQVLLNPDGYTRWFNWSEFFEAGQEKPIFGYIPGQLGNLGNPSAGLNAYKYFTDGIGVNASAFNYLKNSPGSRGQFTPGTICYRNYQLRFLKGDISFQYAVIAHWMPPEGSSPYSVDDFPIEANADEAPAIKITDSSSFQVTGDHTCAGNVILDISVWDWTAEPNDDGIMEEYQIRCFSDAWGGVYEVPMIPMEEEKYYYTFNATIPIDYLDSIDPIPVWIEVFYPGLDYSNNFGINNDAEGPLAGYSFKEIPVYPEPLDVSPQWANYKLRDICVYGNNAYIVGGISGKGSFLNIWDVSDPYNPVSIKWLEIPGSARRLAISHGYAFIAAGGEIMIVNVIDPLNAHIVMQHEVPANGIAMDAFVQNDKAFVPILQDGFNIYHINPPQNSYLVKTVYDNSVYQNTCVFTEGDYAYVGASDLIIINIDPPESAGIVCEIKTPLVNAVSVSDGYAYVATEDQGSVAGPPGLAIVDISDPENGSVVKLLEEPGDTYDVFVQGDYAYVTNFFDLYIVDISSPENAFITEIVDMNWAADAIWVKDEFAYVVGYSSFNIVHIDPAGSSEIIWTQNVLTAPFDVSVDGEYAYVADGHGLRILDIDPIEDADIIGSVYTPGKAVKVDISDGLAYVIDEDLGLYIIDTDPPETPSLIKFLEVPVTVNDVRYSSGYSYVAAHDGLYIFDTDPPEFSHQVNMVVSEYWNNSVFISENRAFLTCGNEIKVIDIDPPETAYICHTITDLPESPEDIFIVGDYAYITGYNQPDLMVMDINPLEEAHIVNSVNAIGRPKGLYVSGGYAYIPTNQFIPYDESYLHIMDIDPVESAFLVHSIDLPCLPYDVYVFGNHLFVADFAAGLLIYQIWN